MNRRNLIKSIPFLGLAPFVQAEEYPWPLECTLAPFQKKIWEAYNKHENNLFIMPPKSGKTFMFNRLYEIAGSKNTNLLIFDNFGSDGARDHQGLSTLGSEKTKRVIFLRSEIRNENWVKLTSPNFEVLEFSKDDINPLA